MRFDVFTLFPEWFDWMRRPRHLAKAALSAGLEVRCFSPRDTTPLAHGQVDDSPYGGGPGMVIRADVMAASLEAVYGEPEVALLCGRYEGFDERVHEVLANDAISLGPFVLAGGEVAAMAVIDAVARKLEGALGNVESVVAESFSEALGGGLEHPHYTRPAVFLGHEVPPVLLSGDHGAIARWRAEHVLPPRTA